MSQKILCVTDLDGTFIKDSIRINDEDLQTNSNNESTLKTNEDIDSILYNKLSIIIKKNGDL